MHPTATQAISRTAALLAVALAATGVAAVPAGSAAAPASRVVVTSLAGDVASAARAVQAAGGTVLDRLSLIGGVSASLPRGSVLAPSFRVVPDSPLSVTGSDDTSASLATGVRAALGLGAPSGEGAGITVAVVDTGVAEVADLAGRVRHVNVSGAPDGDGYGHGTFVSGLVAGDGTSSNGAYAGVAPAARILDVKVADDNGRTDLVTVLKGLQAIAADKSVDVVNLSLSSGSPLPYQIDPLSAALEGLWRRGVTVVVPAGNDGPTAGTIASPGTDPVLLTAGGLDVHGTATTADDTVAEWSGRGPAPQGVQKPDLVAPGAHVVSLRVAGSTIDRDNPQGRVGTGYFKGSGTSFSTAATAGAVAALLDARPGLSPDRVKALLKNTATNGAALGGPDAAGAGALDLDAAYDGTVGKANSGVGGEIIPGSPAAWAAFLDALLRGDEETAASSWSKLSQAARNWAASSWSSLDVEARNWAARNWAARNWAGATVEEWAARNWAARNWAARNWADSDWSASSWSAGNWAAGNWAASSWSAGNWAAGNWATADWSAGNWAASSWSSRNWAAGNWAAGNWAAGNWAAGNWTAGNWAASSWSARNWSATWR
ncbi:MAG: S8 family serine peptidase [Frankiaceae bacterium]|nr:S8 family serine peptidase [Frankiaceae bacterium]